MNAISHIVLLTVTIVLTGCEYGDKHGSAAYSDIRLGLKVHSKDIFAFRDGSRTFTGYFISEYPESTTKCFSSPPPEFFNHPKPLSYEKDQLFVLWQNTPVKADHEFLKDRALLVLTSTNIPQSQLTVLERLISSTNCYYAAHYEDVGNEQYDNISFYLIEPSSRRLHKITNTSSFQKTAEHMPPEGRGEAPRP